MANYDELIALLRSLLVDRFAPKPRYVRGVLGDGLGNVVVPGRPDKSYVRFQRSGATYFEIFNRNVNPVNDWPVLIGELPWQPGLTQVVDTDWSAFEQSGWGDNLGATSPHAPTHEWPDGSPGSDLVNVYLRAIVPGRAYADSNSPTTIFINSFEYGSTGTLWPGIPGLNLQPIMGITVTGTMRYAGVYVDASTNTLAAVTGATTVHTSAMEPPRVAFPAAGVVPIARVRIYGGQSGLAEADIREARRLLEVMPRVKKEIRIEAVKTKLGASAPTEALRAVGASGGVQLDVLQFSKTTQQDCYFTIHAPHYDIDDSVNVNFHLMWLPGASWTAGNYLWKLEYLIKIEGDAYNTGAPTTIQANVTPANAVNMIETEFATAIDLNADYLLWCHFYRDVAGDNGDDTGDVLFFEIEYTANKLGEPI